MTKVNETSFFIFFFSVMPMPFFNCAIQVPSNLFLKSMFFAELTVSGQIINNVYLYLKLILQNLLARFEFQVPKALTQESSTNRIILVGIKIRQGEYYLYCILDMLLNLLYFEHIFLCQHCRMAMFRNAKHIYSITYIYIIPYHSSVEASGSLRESFNLAYSSLEQPYCHSDCI